MKKLITTQGKIQDHAPLAQTQPTGERAFENVEAMLRFDSAQNPVPPEVGARLERSASRLPPPKNDSWWSRLFG